MTDFVSGLKSLSGLLVLTPEQSDFLHDAAEEMARLGGVGVAQDAVKPLPWEEINRDRGDGGQDLAGWEADSGFGPFYEIEVGHSSFDVSYDCQKLGDFDDPDQAKKCAQDHFETRIRAALSEGQRGSRDAERAAYIAGFEAFPGPTGCWDRERISRQAAKEWEKYASSVPSTDRGSAA